MTSKAVRLTLAYIYATGNFPIGVRLETWSAAFNMCTYDLEKLCHVVKPQHMAEIANHPLRLAHDFLLRQGFVPKAVGRRTSHYVNYSRGEDKATAFRSGNAQIDVWLKSEHAPYWQSTFFKADQIKTEFVG